MHEPKVLEENPSFQHHQTILQAYHDLYSSYLSLNKAEQFGIADQVEPEVAKHSGYKHAVGNQEIYYNPPFQQIHMLEA